ncbi:MAG: CZB domain-containing protein [Desulfobulbaceae bacterium]|nr:CZB domain-containing protein [Desulfobulbaceae bacterium]
MSWKNLTIGKKIVLGYSVIILLLVAFSALNYFGIGHLVEDAEEVIAGNKLNGILTQREVDHLNWVAELSSFLNDSSVTTLKVETDDHKCGLGKWLYGNGRKEAEKLIPSLAPLLRELEKPHLHLHESAIKIDDVFEDGDASLPVRIIEIEAAHYNWGAHVRDGLINENSDMDNVETDPTRCILGQWLLSDQAKDAYEKGDPDYKKIWDNIASPHGALHESATRIKKALAAGDTQEAIRIFQNETSPRLEETTRMLQDLRTEAEHELHGMAEANKIFIQQTNPALKQVQTIIHQLQKETRKNIMSDEGLLSSAKTNQSQGIILAAITLVAGLLIAFFTTRGLIKILSSVVGQLDQGAIEVDSVSNQIAAASHNLAEGTSEQAATLEETSSSLEQMASLTRQNAENTKQADIIMRETRDAITAADDSMKKLTVSMEEISTASAETQKIVKTIDEISFQTNLLALNAAVEAARAGEAGAGFAVVADEVRSLAMRAAESAKDTSSLIDATMEKVRTGEDLLSETSGSFDLAAKASDKVSNLVTEIATASSEQAQGLDQVNKAVSEIDKVTQVNAAVAEESASAAEELTAQAASMMEIVAHLQRLVGATTEKKPGRPEKAQTDRETETKRSAGREKQQQAAKQLPSTPSSGKGKKTSGGTKSPEDVIPFDEDDFQDF